MIAVGGLTEYAAGNKARLVRYDRATGKQTRISRCGSTSLLKNGDSSRQRPARAGRRDHHPREHVLRGDGTWVIYDELRLGAPRDLDAGAGWRWRSRGASASLGWLVVSQIPNQLRIARARLRRRCDSSCPTRSASPPTDQQRGRRSGPPDADLARSTWKRSCAAPTSPTPSPNDRDVADRVAGLQKAIKVTAQQDNLFEIIGRARASPKLARGDRRRS